jgi:hypothetical protein
VGSGVVVGDEVLPLEPEVAVSTPITTRATTKAPAPAMAVQGRAGLLSGDPSAFMH